MISFRANYGGGHRWLTVSAVAAYCGIAIAGHGLHGLMPCSHGSCATYRAAAGDCCSCCAHSPSASPLAADVPADAPQLSEEGHDPRDCPICLALAKIKVGRLALFDFGICASSSCYEAAISRALPSAERLLSEFPRGPPLS